MNHPENLTYTKDHEWAKTDGEIVTIGITDYAQDSLGDLVYMELPQVGTEIKSGQTFGVVESIKAVSDLFSPVNGVVTEVNDPLTDSPETLNSDPYDKGWMIKVKVSSPVEGMNHTEYEDYLKTLD
jgi:glycine cleavage system H protein